MSSGQPAATIAATSETLPACTAASHLPPRLPPPSTGAAVPMAEAADAAPLLSQQEFSTAIRDLATAVQGIRLYLIGMQGMTSPSLPPPLTAYPAVSAVPPAQGMPVPPSASPPPPPWASWQPGPSAGPPHCPTHPTGAVSAFALPATGVGDCDGAPTR
nr:formin-like protein 16 [Lolium perenne]